MVATYQNGVLCVDFGEFAGGFTYSKEEGIYKQGRHLNAVVVGDDNCNNIAVFVTFHDGSRQSFVVEKTPAPPVQRRRFSAPW